MSNVSRRQFLTTTGTGVAAWLLTQRTAWAEATADSTEGSVKYPYLLPKLPYAANALEPSIDAETMTIHHTKHHQAYVDNLNKALASHPNLQKKTLGELLRGLNQIPESVRTAVQNNGGGHLNHSMFWNMMAKGGGKPTGDLAKAIDSSFGSIDKFQEEFGAKARTRFGSGWVWLLPKNDKLEIISTANQDTPVMEGKTPILGLDVWEHAYYLKYKNLRDAYVKAWWDVVNWNDVAKRFADAGKAA